MEEQRKVKTTRAVTGAVIATMLMGQANPLVLTGREVIPTTDFDVATALQPANMPVSAAPDPNGAFRFICGAGQLLYDDPIVFPLQRGKSHLHQFYGNLGANANSTYENLRNSGGSTCGQAGPGKAANRSGYWMPAMLDGKGNVVQPDYASVYYKRWPKASRLCTERVRQRACVDLPNGLKFIMGRNMLDLAKPPIGNFTYLCTGVQAATQSLDLALSKCTPGRQLVAAVSAPMCWDGVNLDSPDHMSHMAYQVLVRGIWKCDEAHPYRVPVFTLSAAYTIGSGDDTRLWELSSDHMAPRQPRGSTYHADFFGAWDTSVMKMWHDNCLDKQLSCNGGNLGNGKALKGAGAPSYGARNPNRLVPIPKI